MMFGDPYSLTSLPRDMLIGGLTGGIVNGTIAGLNGKNFWSGNLRAPGAPAFSVNNSPSYTDPNHTSPTDIIYKNGKIIDPNNPDILNQLNKMQ